MTGREKIRAALAPGGTDQVPGVICYEGIYIRDHWDQLTDCPWWWQSSPDPDHQLAWRRDVIAATGQDWLCLPSCPSRAQREATAVEQRDDGVYLTDRRDGTQRKLERPTVGGWDPAGATGPVAPPSLPQRPEDVDAAVPMPPEFDAESFLAAGHADLAAALLAGPGAELFPIHHVCSPLWCCYGAWGFEGMMLLLADRPDLIHQACQRYLAQSIADARRSAALGAEGIWIEECLTDMISPAAFESINAAYLRPLVAEIRRLGLKSIYYYCGDPAGKWDTILSVGPDALSLEESKKGFTIDLAEVVDRVAGRCSVLGNLDAIAALEKATDEALRAAVARQLALVRELP